MYGPATFNDGIKVVVVLFLDVEQDAEDGERVVGVVGVVDGVADVAPVRGVEVHKV
jgi:hypothetical protein